MTASDCFNQPFSYCYHWPTELEATPTESSNIEQFTREQNLKVAKYFDFNLTEVDETTKLMGYIDVCAMGGFMHKPILWAMGQLV